MTVEVDDRHYRGNVVLQREEHAKRKPVQDGSSSFSEDDGELKRRFFDSPKGGARGLEELRAETGPLGLVPERRLEGVGLRLRANPELAHLARLSQPHLETFENFLPRTSLVGSGTMCREARFQELALPVRERHLLDARRDVVPQRLDVVDLLIDGQLIETGGRHG